MAKKATKRGKSRDEGKLYQEVMKPEDNAPTKVTVGVECIVRFASDRSIALISKDGNSLNAIFGEKLMEKKLEDLMSHFRLDNPKQLKGKAVVAWTTTAFSEVLDISAR